MKRLITWLMFLAIMPVAYSADDWAQRYPSGTPLQVITPTTLAGYGYLTSLTGLTLDQTTHQHVINDYPRFDAGIGLVGNYGLYWRDVADANTIAYISYDGDLTMRAVTGDLKFVAGGGDVDFDNDNLLTTGTLSAGAITSSTLTSGRIPYASTGGLLIDNSALTTYAASAGTGNTVEIDVDGLGATSGIPGILIKNTTASTSGVKQQNSPALILSSQGYGSGADKQYQWALVNEPKTSYDAGVLNFYYKLGSGSFTSKFNINSTYGFTIETNGIGETSNDFRFQLANSTPASVSVNQFSPEVKMFGTGWKTDATAGSQQMVIGFGVKPEKGAANPIGVLKYFYGTNISTPIATNELYRLEWGDRLGAIFNDQSINGYIFRVEGNTDANLIYANGATDQVGIGSSDFDGTPATGKLIVKGSTNDGSTNIFVGRDSDEANVATLDTNGVFTALGGLVIPSGITPAPAVVGAIFLDTDASANGSIYCYANGGWRKVIDLP